MRRPRPSPRPWLVGLACLLGAPASLPAQQPMPRPQRPANADDPKWRLQTDVFRQILEYPSFSFKPLSSWMQLKDRPEKTILIIVGRPPVDSGGGLVFNPGGPQPIGLRDFVERGGAVLIASDYRVRSGDLRAVTGGWIMGDKVSAVAPRNARWALPDDSLRE